MKTPIRVEPPASHRKPSLPSLAMAATALAASTLVTACQGTVRTMPTGGRLPLDPPSGILGETQPEPATVVPADPPSAQQPDIRRTGGKPPTEPQRLLGVPMPNPQ
jgi:hypothetical protein